VAKVELDQRVGEVSLNPTEVESVRLERTAVRSTLAQGLSLRDEDHDRFSEWLNACHGVLSK
jgi:hypothetical protein